MYMQAWCNEEVAVHTSNCVSTHVLTVQFLSEKWSMHLRRLITWPFIVSACLNLSQFDIGCVSGLWPAKMKGGLFLSFFFLFGAAHPAGIVHLLLILLFLVMLFNVHPWYSSSCWCCSSYQSCSCWWSCSTCRCCNWWSISQELPKWLGGWHLRRNG